MSNKGSAVFSFSSTALLDWYVTVAPLLQTGSVYIFVYGFFVLGSQRLKPAPCPHCDPVAFVQESFSSEV